jgi:hypothetical protein
MGFFKLEEEGTAPATSSSNTNCRNSRFWFSVVDALQVGCGVTTSCKDKIAVTLTPDKKGDIALRCKGRFFSEKVNIRRGKYLRLSVNSYGRRNQADGTDRRNNL